MPLMASAQKVVDPVGYVTYSLPSTTLVLDVEAVQESFYCGPYARYAEKYLGIKVRQKDETKWQITQVSLTPVVEADLGKRFTLAVKDDAPDLAFLKLTSAGLVAFSDGGMAPVQTWSFHLKDLPTSLIRECLRTSSLKLRLYTEAKGNSRPTARCLSSRIWWWRNLLSRRLQKQPK